MEDKNIKIQGKEVNQKEFEKMKEDLSKDPSKKLKQVKENEYTVLSVMKGWFSLEELLSDQIKQKKVRLSKKEKDYIEKIASILGKDFKEVQDVFLSLLACITMDLYSKNNEFCIPYLFDVKVIPKKTVIEKGFKLEEEYSVVTSEAFHDIFSKIETKQDTWIEDFIKGLLYRELQKRIMWINLSIFSFLWILLQISMPK